MEQIREKLFESQPWLKRAMVESRRSTYQHKIGCVVVKGGSLLSTGFNQIRHNKIGQRYTRFAVSLHAERDALTKIKKEDIKGSTLYIYREFKSGMPANAEPCDCCAHMLYELDVKRVIFTINEEPYYKEVKL